MNKNYLVSRVVALLSRDAARHQTSASGDLARQQLRQVLSKSLASIRVLETVCDRSL